MIGHIKSNSINYKIKNGKYYEIEFDLIFNKNIDTNYTMVFPFIVEAINENFPHLFIDFLSVTLIPLEHKISKNLSTDKYTFYGKFITS